MNRAPAFKREVTDESALGGHGETTSASSRGPEAPPRPGAAVGPCQGLTRSFRFALDGLAYVLVTQRNFRLQLSAGLLAIGLGIYCHLAPLEWVAILGCATAVLTLEMLNTALEAAIDMVTRDYHPLAKIAKDAAAGAVLVASAGALVIGIVIFYPHLAHLWPGKM